MKYCHWVNPNNPAYVKYHDTEWGVPVHDDQKLFEMLLLEMFMSGLSWECILNKREAFRKAFDNFDLFLVANYDDDKITELLSNPDIIRHKSKIKAAVHNAEIFLKIQNQFMSFDTYLWNWTDGRQIISDGTETTSPLSDKIALDLKLRGMKYLGSTTVFSYLCAVGVIFAHEKECHLFPHKSTFL